MFKLTSFLTQMQWIKFIIYVLLYKKVWALNIFDGSEVIHNNR